MSLALKEWIASDEFKRVKGLSREELDFKEFFRDPARPQMIDPEYFYSPADGVIVNQEIVKNMKERILDIKGKPYTLPDLMQDNEYDKPSLVIEIFMTSVDVHVNRIPYAGNLIYKEIEPLSSKNYPMLKMEKDLFRGVFDESEMIYMRHNQRFLNTIYSHTLRHKYYVIQIADSDVKTVTPFSIKQNQPFQQNERFSMVRFGSQVDLIIPLSQRFNLEFVQKETCHVEGGIDRLVKISFNPGVISA